MNLLPDVSLECRQKSNRFYLQLTTSVPGNEFVSNFRTELFSQGGSWYHYFHVNCFQKLKIEW